MATLSELRTRARELSDTVNSNNPSDATFNRWLNAGIAKLRTILSRHKPDDYVTSTEITSTGAITESLPSDIYKIRGVEKKVGTDRYIPLRKFNWEERNKSGLCYRRTGTTLRFSTKPSSGDVFRVWYIERATALAIDADTFDASRDEEEFVSTFAARRALLVEESDTTDITQELIAIQADVIDAATDYDNHEPDSVTDVRYDFEDYELWDY